MNIRVGVHDHRHHVVIIGDNDRVISVLENARAKARSSVVIAGKKARAARCCQAKKQNGSR
jgi:hypothetical protein